MSESKTPTTPFELEPFNGGQESPHAGTDIERMLSLADKQAGPELAKLGEEMRSRYMTSHNVAERTK